MAEKLTKRRGVWYFRFTDADGKRVMRRGSPDKRTAEEMLAAVLKDVARVRAGVVNKKELAYKHHEETPLSEHLAAWAETLSYGRHARAH